jgi:WD40 repeat protein
MMMTRIWYIKRDDLWVTTGTDFKLYKWNVQTIFPANISAQVGKAYVVHNDQITDLIEIDEPRCIATCSMDRSIVLFDIVNGFTIRVIKTAHDTAV